MHCGNGCSALRLRWVKQKSLSCGVAWEQDKNQINPLERMEGDALMLCFRLGLIRASSYRPNQNHTTTFILKVTILPKAINRKNLPILWRTALQAEARW